MRRRGDYADVEGYYQQLETYCSKLVIFIPIQQADGKNSADV